MYLLLFTGATVPRDFQADILFLVDSSQTISKRKFLQELEFVKAFARKFDVSSEKSRVGVITFGNTPILSIRFEDYGNILSFSEGVNRVPYQGGQKSLNNALVFAARVLDLSKTRPKADKILVLLTDGQQPLGYDPKEGSVEALRQLGVHINVIGAGGNVSMQELRKLTLSPDDLFYSRTFDALILQAPIVFKRTMNGRFTIETFGLLWFQNVYEGSILLLLIKELEKCSRGIVTVVTACIHYRDFISMVMWP